MDWGGVLTAPVDEAMAGWIRREQIDLEVYRTVMRAWTSSDDSPVRLLERGLMSTDEFEQRFAAVFGEHGFRLDPNGLLARVLDGLSEVSDDMVNLVRRIRRAGVRTALLSNSWGEHYPEHLWIGAFDTMVVSGRVGIRKPDAEIFRHTADLLKLRPEQCVMVDDLRANVQGAVAVGMVGVLHESFEQTRDELEVLFALDLG